MDVLGNPDDKDIIEDIINAIENICSFGVLKHDRSKAEEILKIVLQSQWLDVVVKKRMSYMSSVPCEENITSTDDLSKKYIELLEKYNNLLERSR